MGGCWVDRGTTTSTFKPLLQWAVLFFQRQSHEEQFMLADKSPS
jgi:hypothetical protein